MARLKSAKVVINDKTKKPSKKMLKQLDEVWASFSKLSASEQDQILDGHKDIRTENLPGS